LVETLPDGAINTLVAGLRRGASRAALPYLVPTPSYTTAVRALLAAWPSDGVVTEEALVLAIECARDRQRDAERTRVSIVWTGPASEAVPVRRTDQALLEVIDGASERLIVMSFAVYRIPDLVNAFLDAIGRGVSVAFVVEPRRAAYETESAMANRLLGHELASQAQVLVWAEDRRMRAPSGDAGVVHAKCAVADGNKLLVSSANLTQYALSINMELGLLIKGGQVPQRVQSHLEALIASGELRQIANHGLLPPGPHL
jgi:phosphatidylserine/phosphatidylglycerophosphate/cardiolipin synthase-like enzyme